MKHRLLILVGLFTVIAACDQAKPTPVYLPTSTPPRVEPTAFIAQPTFAAFTATAQPSPTAEPAASPMPQPTTTPTATPAPTLSPAPESPEVEPTQQSPTQVPEEAFPPSIALEPVLTGFQAPVYVTYASETAPWGSRLLVIEKAGRILVVENDRLQPVPLLDITDRVGASGSEQGLLSVAFPPDFDTTRVFYVNHTNQRGDTVVARFRLMESDPPQADPASEQKILEIAQPAQNHNGGQLQFGPDGYLYIGMGDGGRAGDPWGNAQNPQELLGKLLRIDVTDTDTYRIPSQNPFLDWPDARSEIWALGLRNPWRFSFDRVTGDLYIADVGQNEYEEVNFQPAYSTGGENYGWDIMESYHCFEPASDCDATGLIPPVAEYDHSLGCSITGGYVYRGKRYPHLAGVYFFGDYCSGRIWALRQTASGEWRMAFLLESGTAISSFGQDASGELYVVGYQDGTIYHLTALP